MILYNFLLILTKFLDYQENRDLFKSFWNCFQIARRLAQSLLANMAAQGMNVPGLPAGDGANKKKKSKQQPRQDFSQFKVCLRSSLFIGMHVLHITEFQNETSDLYYSFFCLKIKFGIRCHRILNRHAEKLFFLLISDGFDKFLYSLKILASSDILKKGLWKSSCIKSSVLCFQFPEETKGQNLYSNELRFVSLF